MKYSVVTIGDVMKDIFVFPAQDEMLSPLRRGGEKFLLFEHGDKISLDDMHEDIGGTAGNVAAGLAKLGVKTGIISKIGRDNQGQEITEALDKAEVGTLHLDEVKNKKR